MPASKENPFEVALYIDLSSETEIFVEGQKATVFQLGDRLSLVTPSLQIEIQFRLIEGEGNFCGHLFRSNRPTQIACKGPLLHEAFDRQICLRSLRRLTSCVVQALIFVKNGQK